MRPSVWHKIGVLCAIIIHVKSHATARLPKRYESDLSHEVLYILVGHEASKIVYVKIRG